MDIRTLKKKQLEIFRLYRWIKTVVFITNICQCEGCDAADFDLHSNTVTQNKRLSAENIDFF